MNHRVAIAVRWLAGVICLAAVLSSTASAQEMPPTLVVTDQVQSMEFSDQIYLVGRTRAWVESRVVAEVAGRVEAIVAREGVPVAAGASLVRIDDERIALELKSKAAEARQAQLQAELAHTHLKRTEEMFARNLVSRTTADSAAAWAGIADERYNQLEAERRKLELDVEHCDLAAPFFGYTGRRLVDVGEWVSPGTPVFEMVDLSKVRVTVDLPERYFGHLALGSTARIALSSDSTVTLEGTVTGIAAAAVEETHTFPVTVTVANKQGRLGAGMLVRATLSLSDRALSLAVSKDAIIRQGSSTMVYTVVDGKAQPVPVTTSSTSGKMIAVSGDGLKQGMPVVVRGNERIFPGSPVRIADTGDGQAPPIPEHGE
jgi:membrane fusion protein (multidrug efflux system)